MVFIIFFKDILEPNTLHIPFIIKFWIFTEILKNLLR